MNDKIKWRGSEYTLLNVEDNRVFWENPVSRFRGECSVEAWKNSDPYEGKLG